MGGRGQSDTMWKRQLRTMSKNGSMPVSISGSLEQQAEVFNYIDKLYQMPETQKINVKDIIDQGDGVYVQYGNYVSKAGYPSKGDASDAEKRGVLKWLLYNNKKKRKS